MRKKIAAGNWKMNKTFEEGQILLSEVVNMVNVWMQKEPNLWEIHLKRLNPSTDYMENNLLWVYDFFLYVHEKNINVQSLLTT